MPKIRINGVEVEAGDRENLIDAAARIGVHIPHFCYHPGLSVAGNCRQCLVEVEGVAKPQIACNTPVKEGLAIRTDTPALQELHRGVLEFLLLNHPIDCPVCDQAGECRLQEYYMRHGLYDARRNVAKVHKPKVVDLGPLVTLDVERCVLCSRCVRFCQEVAGTEELYIAERGHHAEISTFPGQPLTNPYSGNVVDICPVGALLSKDFRFKSRVWWLKQADSICASCSRGCNMRIDHHWNQVQRLVPRPNPAVNQYWMCDRGRLEYHHFNDRRLTAARDGTQALPTRDAVESLAAKLAPLEGDFAVLLSPKLATEDLLLLRWLFTAVAPAKRLGAGSLEPLQPEDAILRKAEPHPNGFTVRALSLETDAGRLVREGGTRGLLVIGDDPVRWAPDLATALGRYTVLAAALCNENETAAAVTRAGGMLLPLATHAEYAGSFTNFEGRVQRFAPALALHGGATPGYELGLQLAESLGRSFGPRPERLQDLLAAIWTRCLPAGVPLTPVDWAACPQDAVVAGAHRTAQPVTRGYTEGDFAWT